MMCADSWDEKDKKRSMVQQLRSWLMMNTFCMCVVGLAENYGVEMRQHVVVSLVEMWMKQNSVTTHGLEKIVHDRCCYDDHNNCNAV